MGAYPRVVHANPDGLKDLLIGEAYGTLRMFCNVNTDDVPVFDTGTLLQVGEPGLEEDIDVGSRAVPDIVDWNSLCDWTGDGLWDVLIGCEDGMVHLYQGIEAFHVEKHAVPWDGIRQE